MKEEKEKGQKEERNKRRTKERSQGKKEVRGNEERRKTKDEEGKVLLAFCILSRLVGERPSKRWGLYSPLSRSLSTAIDPTADVGSCAPSFSLCICA